LAGRCAIKGTNIDLNETDLPAIYISWPTFHNAVAAAISVRFTDAPADAWYGTFMFCFRIKQIKYVNKIKGI